MLALLRRHSRSWLIWTIFAVLIFVFIFFFGPQTEGFAPSSRSWAVRAPSATVYDTQLNATLQRTLDILGSRGRLEDAEFAQRRLEIAENIALVHVLADRARREGLEISRDELSCYIVNWNRGYLVNGEAICERYPEAWAQLYPNVDFAFYSTMEGTFSESYIIDVRGRFNMSIEEYERWKQSELLAMRYLELLASSLPISADILDAMTSRRADMVNLEFIELPSSLAVASVNDEDIERLIADEESTLRARYAARQDSFSEEAALHLSQIYIGRSSDSDEADAQAELVQEILAQAQGADADFAALANTHSTLARDDGGDLGWRTRDSLAGDVWERASRMSVGEVAVLEQDNSWRILKLEDSREERTRPYDEVAAELAEDLLLEGQREEAAERQRERARRILEHASAGLTLEQALAAEETESGLNSDEERDVRELELSLEVKETGEFSFERTPQIFDGLGGGMQAFTLPASPADQVPGIGTSAELTRIAFALSESSPLHPEPVEVDGSTYIVRLLSRSTSDDPEIASAAERALRAELSDNFLRLDSAKRRLLLHDSNAELPSFLQETLREAITKRQVRFRANILEIPAAELELPTL